MKVESLEDSIGNYIVDFYCPREKLIIELDGAHHFTPEGLEKDKVRTSYLESLNFKVMRFENKLVFEQLDQVLAAIKQEFK